MLYYYTNFYKVFGITINAVKSNFSIKIMIITSSISYVLIKLINNILKKTVSNSNLYYDLKIIDNNNKIQLKGFLDTGNTLVEPITKSNVIIVQYEKLKNILNTDLQNILDENFDIMKVLVSLKEGEVNKFKIIPFCSIGNENDLLLGFKPEKIVITIDGEDKELNNIIIGICSFKLSNDYEVLLNNNISLEW